MTVPPRTFYQLLFVAVVLNGPNLFVSMLQRMGLETDKFASATGTMRGVELA
jgi:hypothetical protein